MLPMQSAGKETIRSSKKRRHSHGLDSTPTSEKTKRSPVVSQSATVGQSRKRVREQDEETANVTVNPILQSPGVSGGTPIVKRPRKKPSDSESADHQEGEQVSTATPGIASLPGQKVALLAMIRQRLTDLNNRTLYVRKLPRNTSLAQLKALCPTSINARLPSKSFSNRRRHAFIEFKSEEMARTALKSITGKLIADRPIKAELCFDRSSSESNLSSNKGQKESDDKHLQWAKPNQRQLREFSLTSLHLSCVPRTTTPDEVKQLFPKAISFDFNMHPKNKGMGSCRLSFSSEQDAMEAFTSKNNAVLRDCPIIVNFAFKKHRPNRGIIHSMGTELSSAKPTDAKSESAIDAEQRSKKKMQQTSEKQQKISDHDKKKAKSTTGISSDKQKKKQKKVSNTHSSNDFPFPKQPKAKKHKLT